MCVAGELASSVSGLSTLFLLTIVLHLKNLYMTLGVKLYKTGV